MNKKRTILIVDDDKFLLDMYVAKFSQDNFDVEFALSVPNAIGKLKDGLSPDAILTDVLMPDMDGFDFLRLIKEDKLAPRAKIIILSNKGEKTDIGRSMSLGADGYIVKASVIPSEVVTKVKNILES